jgi:prepilin-type N-terminal cleavage/methylation domain-containing protein/prepilin-type processing-associated H-X9-DG protein
MKMVGKNRGFTLIELLVVIAIIALLLSIVVPALGLAKEKARNLQCRANVRSLGQAFRLYSEQSGGKVFGYGSMGLSNLWLTQIADQVGDIDKVRFCSSTKMVENPSTTNSTWGKAATNWVWINGVPQPMQGSFGFNGYLYSKPLMSGTTLVTMPLDEWERSRWENATISANSANIPVFIDAAWVDLWPQDDDAIPANFDLLHEQTGMDFTGSNGPGRIHMYRCMLNRHSGDLSVAFLDGHAEPVPLSKMWSLKWSRAFKTDGREHIRQDGSPIYKK